jgi:hypothetical protein
MNISFKGYPKTFHMQELRAKADRLACDGHGEEAAILHGLLDDYGPTAQADYADELRDVKKDLESANEELEDAAKRADKAQEALESAHEAAREALEASQKALAYWHERDTPQALQHLARSVAALASILK